MNSLMDEPAINLKEGIDLRDLQDPNSEGVVFEVEEEQQLLEADRTNTYFNPEEIVENLYHPDDSSSCDEGEEGSELSQFERTMAKMEDITEHHDGGVVKKILSPGAGPIVPPKSVVKIHYNGFLECADEPFDSSRLRNSEERKRLGNGEMFIGFEIAVSSMKKGELSRFIIRPGYAYGKMGCSPRIPENAILMYEIELLNFFEKDEVDDFYRLTPEDRRRVTFENICKVCKAEKAEAEEFYQRRLWWKALAKYLKACRVFEEYHLKNDEEEQYQQKQLLKIYTNIANCYVKNSEPKRALPFANKALEIDPKHVKAFFWKAKAHYSLANFDQARQNYVKAQKLAPNSAEIKNELIRLNKDFEKFKLQESSYCRKMFSGSLGDTEELKEGKQNKKEEKYACSEDFRLAFKSRLDAFIKDNDIDQMPFPSYQLSVPEIEYMIETAEQMGLDTVQHGEGRFVNFYIKKKKKKK